MMVRFKQTTTGLFWIATLFFTSSVQAGLLYSILDLGTLGGLSSGAYSINSAGQVTGYSYLADGRYHAFITNQQGQMTDLGVLPGYRDSTGIDINDYGKVTGYVESNFSYISNHAFYTDSNNSMVELALPSGDIRAFGINNYGQVTGYYEKAGRNAFVTNLSGQIIGLGTLNGYRNSVGSDVNDSGQVTGWAESLGSSRAFVTDSTGRMIDLGTLGGKQSAGLAINNFGLTTGYSTTISGPQHAFVTDFTGQMIDLGTLGGGVSSGFGINSFGQVVGQADTFENQAHAFVTENNVMKDLNNLLVSDVSNWILRTARDINDSGQIVGIGLHNGAERAFLLTPVSAVPLPGGILLFISGLLGLFSFKSRSKQQLTE